MRWTGQMYRTKTLMKKSLNRGEHLYDHEGWADPNAEEREGVG
jgi:hypothetical protein